MVYSPSNKVGIWCPFKNYSTSIQVYYSNKPQWNSVCGPNPDYNFHPAAPISSHSAFLPSEIGKEYTLFLPIRNPYDRVISQYHWHIKMCGDISFDEWLMVHSKQPVCLPVTTIYERYDHLLKTEDMVEEMRKHRLLINRNGLEVEFPWKNRTENRREMDLSPEHETLIYFLHHSDFVAGGYPRLYK